MTRDTVITVKNRSAGMAVYRIPEDNIRREFAPGESKRITWGELEKLSFQPGGQTLINQYLQIVDSEEAISELNVPAQPEYYMNEAQVKDLLLNGSMDEFLDCLDYAPQGVLDIVKDLAVKLPLQDISKRIAIKNKLGFNCDAAIKHVDEEKMAMQLEKNQGAAAVAQAPGRRTSGSKYKVIE